MPKVIQIGSDFGRYSALYGLSILVHEARHSDCESGLSDETVSKWKNSEDLKALSFAIAKEPCGHSHGLCKSSSVNSGKLVCDPDLKGAYAYQYVFNRAVVNACENCSFSEKLVMQIFALDAASKLPLSPDLSERVGKTLLELPTLQKTTEASTLIHVTLEKVLKQVDDFLLQSNQP